MAQTFNLEIEQGSSYRQDFIVKNPDNSNKDLTDYTARMQFRLNHCSDDVYLDGTTANNKLVIDIGNSLCSIILTGADTESLLYSTYVYDIELVDASGNSKRLVQGKVNVSPEVTK